MTLRTHETERRNQSHGGSERPAGARATRSAFHDSLHYETLL